MHDKAIVKYDHTLRNSSSSACIGLGCLHNIIRTMHIHKTKAWIRLFVSVSLFHALAARKRILPYVILLAAAPAIEASDIDLTNAILSPRAPDDVANLVLTKRSESRVLYSSNVPSLFRFCVYKESYEAGFILDRETRETEKSVLGPNCIDIESSHLEVGYSCKEQVQACAEREPVVLRAKHATPPVGQYWMAGWYAAHYDSEEMDDWVQDWEVHSRRETLGTIARVTVLEARNAYDYLICIEEGLGAVQVVVDGAEYIPATECTPYSGKNIDIVSRINAYGTYKIR